MHCVRFDGGFCGGCAACCGLGARDCERSAYDWGTVETGRGTAWVRAEVVQAAEAQQGAVSTVEVLGAVFAVVCFQFAKYGAAIWKGVITHGGDLE